MDRQDDIDPQETREWLDALEGVLARGGAGPRALPDRAADRQGAALRRVPAVLRQHRVHQHDPGRRQVRIPGDQNIEHTIRSFVRWNAMAMVVRANKHTNVGGHIASFASAATLYDVGFNHFWHAPSDEHGGDLVFFQGHSSPGVYARAFMLGRLTEEQLD